ncbi:hypothetical protein BV20DRAFT_49507 [Pilatotrama ljubarskyi]|nr:hypothetical protein BV20DRAFT_49507 [Pilatotrama ljubarskyi]
MSRRPQRRGCIRSTSSILEAKSLRLNLTMRGRKYSECIQMQGIQSTRQDDYLLDRS